MPDFTPKEITIGEVKRSSPIVTPSVTGSTAQNLATALEALAGGYRKSEAQALKGEETPISKLPGVGEIKPEGESRQDVASRLQSDQLKTFEEIKTAREQGLITASRAKLLTNKAIRSRASDFPGMETALRKEAANFFGQYGPGEGLFDQTSAEASATKALEGLVKQGVKDGFINPYDPYNDQVGIASYAKWQRRLSLAQGEKTILDAAISTGTVTAEAYTNNYMSANVEDVIQKTVSNFIDLSERGEKITDPNDLIVRLGNVEESLVADLSRKLYQIPGATRDTINKQTDAIRSRFKSLKTMAEQGSLLNFLKNKRETLQEAARVGMSHRLPELFSLETAFPNLGKEIMAMADRYAGMSPAQRDNFLATIPSPVLRESFRATIEGGDHFLFGSAVKRALESKTAPTDAFTRSYVDLFALNSAKKGSPSSPDDKESVYDASVSYVLKNVESPLMADFITKEPAVVARIKRDPSKVQQVGNRVRSGVVAIERQMTQEIVGEGSKGGFYPKNREEPLGTLVYEDGEFTIDYSDEYKEQVTSESGLALEGTTPEEEFERTLSGTTPLFIKDLNRIGNIVEVFSTELGINLDEWIEEQTRKFNEGLLKEQERRQKENETKGE